MSLSRQKVGGKERPSSGSIDCEALAFLTRGPLTPDIFVHIETVRRFGFTELRAGQTVWVRYGSGSNGLAAAELKIDGEPDPLSH